MKKKIAIGIGGVCLAICLLIIGTVVWQDYVKNNKGEVVSGSNSEITETTEITESTEVLEEIETETETAVPEDTDIVEAEPIKNKIRLMMIGDNLMHVSIINSGYQADGSRNYDMLFKTIKDHLELADIKITNQETIFGGNDTGFTGYPLFNSPTEIGDAMVKAGFNVVLHGTNHAADRGIAGIQYCLNFWDKYPDMLVMGIYKEEDVENQDIGLLTVDGVTFAILNYTYSPNLASLPKEIQGHLGMLCDWDKNTGMINMTKLHPDVLTDIAKAKEMADVVIVCPHWGTEYTFVPSSYQRTFAEQMTEAGADLILGTHPHVIQPIEWITSPNGNQALCYFSLGNYVSTQYRPQTMLEAMAWVVFETDGEQVEIVEEETGAIPMVYQYRPGHSFENVYFLDEYTEALALQHGILVHGEPGFTYENVKTWADEVLGKWRLQYQDVFKDCIKPEMWR